MDVRPVGASSPVAEIKPIRPPGQGGGGDPRLPVLPTAVPALDATLLHELSKADAEKLIGILQTAHAEGSVVKADLMVRPDDVPVVAAELVRTGGGHATGHIDGKLIVVARMDAQGKIATARDVLDHFRPERIGNWDAKPEALLKVATDLYETGGYVNYLRSGDVAQLIIDNMRFVSFPVSSSPVVDTKKAAWGAGFWGAAKDRPEVSVSLLVTVLLAMVALFYLMLR